jgi:hypothetical protein
LWAALFGGADEDEDSAMASAGRGMTSRSVGARQPTQVAALVPMRNDDDGVRAILLAQAQGQAQAQSNVQPPAPPADTARPRRGVTARTTEPAPAPAAFASVPVDAGTTVALRSNAQAPGGTTVATRSDPAAPDDDLAGSPLVSAYAPLPPHRPKGLAEVAALADIPLPPIRPTSLVANEPRAPTDTPVMAAEPAAAGQLVALDHPLPPSRSQSLASADPALANSTPDTPTTNSVAGTKTDSGTASPPVAGLDRTAAEKAEAPAQLIRLDHPLPPPRPIQFASVSLAGASQGPAEAPRASQLPEPTIGTTLNNRDKTSLQALFDTAALIPARHAGAASVKVANAVVRTALPRVAQDVIARQSSTAGHFQASSAQPVNHFSGKAVQPLNSLGFTTTE